MATGSTPVAGEGLGCATAPAANKEAPAANKEVAAARIDTLNNFIDV
jgi:hypothetical protein